MKARDTTLRIPVITPLLAVFTAAFLLATPMQGARAEATFLDSGDFSQTLTATQLQSLVAPVALYPDPLLAQILQAATYPDQVSEAATVVQMSQGTGGQANQVDSETWDASVIAVAHYPPVVEMMARQISWTTKLGQAYLSQQAGVLQAVQALRRQASSIGNLKTTQQQSVIQQGDAIQIYPTNPAMIYVPTYDPVIVYSQPTVWGGAPLIGFGMGWAVGSAMSTTTVDWAGGTVVNYPPGTGWRGAYSGTTANGTSYAGRYGSAQLANGADVRGYQGAAVGDGGAAAGRGWSYSNGGNDAGGFSRTVVTDNGIYNVHGAGAEGSGGNSAGYVTATEVNRDGQVSSDTVTDRDGDVQSSDDLRGDTMFSEARDDDWHSSYADRGAWSRGAGDYGAARPVARMGGFGGGFRR